MTDQFTPREPGDLEQDLRDLGQRLAYPSTPPLARRVGQRLAATPPARRSWWFLAPSQLALALLAALLLAGAALLAWPAARAAVADRLGLRGVEIIHVPAVTTPTPAPPVAAGPTATPLPACQRLHLGAPISLAEARAGTPFPIRLPSLPELDEPDETCMVGSPGNQVAFVYAPRPGWPSVRETGVALVLIAFQGRVDQGVLIKGVGPDTQIQPVTVNGGRGFWLAGAPHSVAFFDEHGQVSFQSVRLAGNVLLWEQGGVTYRLEGVATLDQALRVAGSLG